MSAIRKRDGADLKKHYPILAEVGMILSLAVLIVAFRADFHATAGFEIVIDEQEIIVMEDIQPTIQTKHMPLPPRPQIPIIVSDDTILDQEPPEIDATLDFDRANLMATPPPMVEEPVEDDAPEIFEIVEDEPVLIGGLASIQQNIRYPEMARRIGLEGRVFVQFIVDDQGNVVDPVVIRGLGGGLDEEALRAVSEAKFTPGRQRGQPVHVRMSIPITFRLR
jgi:periplasmic protein TonB